jgi:hypothetical protein
MLGSQAHDIPIFGNWDGVQHSQTLESDLFFVPLGTVRCYFRSLRKACTDLCCERAAVPTSALAPAGGSLTTASAASRGPMRC